MTVKGRDSVTVSSDDEKKVLWHQPLKKSSIKND